MLGMIAEMELGSIRDRQRAGIEAAKVRGVYKGRSATFNRARILALPKEGMGATEIAKAIECKRGKVYKARLRGSTRLTPSRDPRGRIFLPPTTPVLEVLRRWYRGTTSTKTQGNCRFAATGEEPTISAVADLSQMISAYTHPWWSWGAQEWDICPTRRRIV